MTLTSDTDLTHTHADTYTHAYTCTHTRAQNTDKVTTAELQCGKKTPCLSTIVQVDWTLPHNQSITGCTKNVQKELKKEQEMIFSHMQYSRSCFCYVPNK